jgi:23S rRNA (adenine2503-C2)-methyltransferase
VRESRTLLSAEDLSANFVLPAEGGAFEARYVRRDAEYFIAYLSSHAGCDRACRFCHLTQTGQTSMTPATRSDYLKQAHRVLQHYFLDTDEWTRPPLRMHYNFMARGEPLANPTILDGGWNDLSRALYLEAWRVGLRDVEFKVSTIMPMEMAERGRRLQTIFGTTEKHVTIYYSLYSMRESFRRRWLPRAMDPKSALDILASWQMNNWGGQVVLHWPFIEGENDDLETIEEIIYWVQRRGLKARFNAVRYNPYSEAQGRESSEEIIDRNFHLLNNAFGDPNGRIVPRVGFDVKASCGMFVEAS